MRKIAALFFLLFYSVLSFGIEAELHYCCGKLRSVHFFEFGEENHDHHAYDHQGCCESDGCMRDTHISVHYEGEHLSQTGLEIPSFFVWETPLLQTFHLHLFIEKKEDAPAYYSDLPFPPKIPKYTLYCNSKSDLLS